MVICFKNWAKRRKMRRMQNNKLAIYMRLSKEDGEAEESFSISNQRYIIENYIRATPELNCMEKEEYIDDGGFLVQPTKAA